MFLNLLKDTFADSGNLGFWSSLINHMTDKGYTGEFNGLMQITPMADYFLQNRPMMIGLPVFVIVNFLLIKGFEEKNNKLIILAGILTALLIKFQLFSFVACGLIFTLGLIIYNHAKNYPSKSILFFTPSILFIIFFSIFFQTGQTLTKQLFDNLSFGLWDKTKDLIWYLSFYLANFGLSFLITMGMGLGYFYFLTKKYKPDKKITFLFLEFFILFLIPHLVKFTVYQFDMFKFFYFMVIPMSVISAIFLTRILKVRFIGVIAVVLILIISSLNSINTLAWSYLNKYQGYTEAEYEAGIWIRQNTPQRSVFATFPSVHSSVSEIGGRLRVLSYIVWPYSHGFNKGEDNVFTRQDNLQMMFDNLNDKQILSEVVNKYQINYLYIGSEEINHYQLQNITSDKLELVYNDNGVKIYKVK